MSFKTWKKEFYPTNAYSVKATRSELAAAKHALMKWRGFLNKNLKKHGVTVAEIEQQILGIRHANGCALCKRKRERPCEACCICWCYSTWTNAVGGKPKALIKRLEEAIKKMQKQKRTKGK